LETKADHTFVIPAYNDSPYIEQCILSLLSQTLKGEILITTSTPSEFIKNISKKYNIELIVNERQEGIAGDWSFSYNNCKTKYVTLAHQDDIYYPDYVSGCVSLAEKNSDSLIVFTDYAELSDRGLSCNNINLLIKKLILNFYFLFKSCLSCRLIKRLMLAAGSPVCCPSVMYNRENIGHFEFNKLFKINPDWDAWLRLAEYKGGFAYTRKRLVAHRLHGDSVQ
jgi:glycosyltransferase involved in cell wall biosynthesis